MKISNVRRGAGQPVIAWFDLDLDDGAVRVIDMYIKRNSAGELRVYAPSPGSKRIVTFTTDFADRVIAAANADMGGRTAHGHTKAA